MSPSPHQLVRIYTDRSTPLSKHQKTFNRLTKRIAEQEALLTQLRTALDTGRIRVQTELAPLHAQFDQLRAEMVRLFDRAYEREPLTKAERRKLTDLITSISYELIQKGHSDLTAIHDRYHEGGFEAAMADADEQSAATLRHMAEQLLGIEFDDAADLSSPEKVRAYISEQVRQRAAAEPKRPEEATAQQAEQAKSAKQQAREARKAAETVHATKAVRALYMDLVKAFHPDREPDEAEKERKTAIMQRVTEAYEKSDLMGLFRLQLEFERIDQAHLEKLADAQLLYYNKILTEQVEELDTQLKQVQADMSSLTGSASYGFSATGLEFALNNEISDMKRVVKHLKADLKTLTDPAYLRAWLKQYRNAG